jgi:hypothetical protein
MDPLRGYAVHFTRGVAPDEAARARVNPPAHPSHLELMAWLNAIDDTGFRSNLSILWEGRVRPTSYPMGVGRKAPEVDAGHRAACFSESPLDDLVQLVSTRSRYGLGFRQGVLGRHGGRPVQYLESGSAEALTFEQAVDDRIAAGVDPTDPFWADTPFIDIVRPHNSTSWEQEWRVPGGFDFAPDDVAFCFLPADLHGAARDFFEEHQAANTGPAYLGRYIDPLWDRATIECVLAVPAAGP